jgi:hypothetical protein
MKIVHIWDQASYVENLMKIQNIKNVEMERFPKLPDFGLAEKIVSNSFKSIPYLYSHALDSFIRRKALQNTFFEFHSVTLLERYPQLIPRTVLHIHGSEVRLTNDFGLSEDTTSEFTRFALANVPLTLYSTPELQEVINKYSSKAEWAPHVTNLSNQPTRRYREISFEFDAVFPSSLYPWKGATRVLDLIAQSRPLSPELKFAGINRGGDVESALELGMYLSKAQNRKLFQRFITQADIALGQGFGLIGSADIESIQLGLRFFPLTANPYYEDVYNLSSRMLPNSNSLLADFLTHKANCEHRYSEFEERVLKAHSAQNIANRLTKIYGTYLS